jgi:AraC-like DNA-binding protein
MKQDVIRYSIQLEGFDPEHLADIVNGGRMEHYILTRSKCRVRHERWACGSFSVDVGLYSFPVRVLGNFARNRWCLGYMRDLTEPTWVNGFEAHANTFQLYPAGCELNYRAAPNGEWVAIEFEVEALQRVAGDRLGCELELPVDGASNFEVPRGHLRELDAMIQRSLRNPFTSAEMVEPMLGTIAEMIVHTQSATYSDLARRWRNRARLLDRAEQYLKMNAGTPFNSKALATAVGITARMLQMHFIDAYGISPGHWARCLALHRVRDRLLKTDSSKFTIEGLAHECGFRHMGRFSAYYHDLFGEFPSATMTAAAVSLVG